MAARTQHLRGPLCLTGHGTHRKTATNTGCRPSNSRNGKRGPGARRGGPIPPTAPHSDAAPLLLTPRSSPAELSPCSGRPSAPGTQQRPRLLRRRLSGAPRNTALTREDWDPGRSGPWAWATQSLGEVDALGCCSLGRLAMSRMTPQFSDQIWLVNKSSSSKYPARLLLSRLNPVQYIGLIRNAAPALSAGPPLRFLSSHQPPHLRPSVADLGTPHRGRSRAILFFTDAQLTPGATAGEG